MERINLIKNQIKNHQIQKTVLCNKAELQIEKMNNGEEILNNKTMLNFYEKIFQDLYDNTKYIQEWFTKDEYVNENGKIKPEALHALITFYQIDPCRKSQEIGGIYQIKNKQKDIGFASVRLNQKGCFEMSFYLYDKAQHNKIGYSIAKKITDFTLESNYFKQDVTQPLYITCKEDNHGTQTMIEKYNQDMNYSVFTRCSLMELDNSKFEVYYATRQSYENGLQEKNKKIDIAPICIDSIIKNRICNNNITKSQLLSSKEEGVGKF